MVTVARLKRLLLALSEPALRIGWLEEQLELWSVSEAATLLHGLCEESERSDPEAREALLSVVMLLAQRGDDALVQALREEAAGRRLLSLDRLVRAGPAPVLRAPSVAEEDEQRERLEDESAAARADPGDRP